MIRESKRISKLLKIECSQCGACCSDPIIEVTHYDLRRLVKYLGVSADKLIKLYAKSDFHDDNDEYDWIRFSYGMRKLGLRKRRDGTCIFLSEERRCVAYSARPVSCRVFPVDVIMDENNDITDLELSDVIREKFIKCRLNYGAGRSLASFMRVARQARNETASYWKKIEEWNETHDDAYKNDFLSFLGLSG